MYNRNAAYDFGALEKPKRRGQIVELPSRAARRKERLKTKRKILTGVFSVFMIAAAAVSTFILGQVKLTEITDQTEKAEKVLGARECENTELHMAKESQGAEKALSNDSVHNEIVKIPKEELKEIH
ncbi:MAG: hypothetical protein Q4D57_04870 [Clostridia bacterium]|nr:hypothetical protein [Clostridia bacterium]